MTLVVGVVHKGTVYLGGDRFAGNLSNYQKLGQPKVFTGDLPVLGGPSTQFVAGYAGCFTCAQIFQHALEFPPYKADSSVDEYFVMKLFPAMRTAWEGAKHLHCHNGVTSMDGVFLVGFKGQLRYLQADFNALAFDPQEAAIGAGEELALGSLASTRNGNHSPEERLTLALQAGASHSPLVTNHVDIVKV